MEKYGFVYIWFDKKHKRYYVGSHWGTENDGYISSSSWLNRAYKRRPEDFKRRILSKVYSNHRDLLIEEHKWLLMIKKEELKIKYYNIRIWDQKDIWFANNDKKMSISRKISNSVKALHNDPVYREKYLNSIKKRDYSYQTEEWFKKRSETQKATLAIKFNDKRNKPPRSKANSEEHRKKNSDGGKRAWARMTPEQRKKRSENISESLKGKRNRLGQKNASEHNRKIIEANTGKRRSEETKRKQSEIRKKYYADLSSERKEEIRQRRSASLKKWWAERKIDV